MKVVIITLFNSNFKLSDKEEISFRNSLPWLEYRFSLFYKYTYPSVINQTDKEFYWYVCFDINTPKNFLSRFKKNDKKKAFKVIISEYYDIGNRIKRKLYQSFNDDDIIISLRLDSDDSLSPVFIYTLKCIAFRFPTYEGYNFNNGFIVSLKNGVIFKKSFYSNPFYSLKENLRNFKSVYVVSHHLLGSKYVTKNIFMEGIWFQNIHDSNLLNTIKGYPIFNYNGIPDSIKKLYIKPNYLLIIIWYFLVLIKKVKIRIIKIGANK